MRKIKDVIEYAFGTNTSLNDIREFVKDTEELPPDTKVKIERHQGQLDAETYILVVVRGGMT